ncbi:MAG TPA: SDR family NAD(P)-dependent oxidoreductase [Thermoanaerobaculia bacterium]|nr:SDR family NAD(P)-dependent oxidoreductase [Thermoanaerobaculia bacterium]
MKKRSLTTPTIDLAGRVALITGASRGIGRETATLMAAAGASIAINHRSSEEDARTLSDEIGAERSTVIRADVGDPSQVARMVEETIDHFGRLDILVNNAATFALNKFDRDDYEEWQNGWQRTFQVNVFGAANAAFLAMRWMRENGGGKIINVASRAAFRGETEFADYGASKAALVNLTRSLARSCAGDKIIASCVAPGFVDTSMAAEELKLHGDEIVAQIPVGRVAEVADVANVILFLASPLSDYLAGVTIDVNGGSYFH